MQTKLDLVWSRSVDRIIMFMIIVTNIGILIITAVITIVCGGHFNSNVFVSRFRLLLLNKLLEDGNTLFKKDLISEAQVISQTELRILTVAFQSEWQTKLTRLWQEDPGICGIQFR